MLVYWYINIPIKSVENLKESKNKPLLWSYYQSDRFAPYV